MDGCMGAGRWVVDGVERCGLGGGDMAGWVEVMGMDEGWFEGWHGGCGHWGRNCSPVGEAVGRRRHPAGVDKAPCTEVVPDVDGGQPGVGARQRGRATDDAWP